MGSRNVYFDPPENVKMKYPCFVYTLDTVFSTRADNKTYNSKRGYQVTYITKDSSDDMIEKFLELSYTSYQRRFFSDNLTHDVFHIYY